MLIQVKEKSQLTLPHDIVDALGIQEGDKVEILTQDGGIYIRPVALLSKSKFEKINNIIRVDSIPNKKKKLAMSRNAPFKSLIRQPMRALIFMLLVGLATFGFVSRVVEYDILSREINRIEGFYRAVGELVPVDPLNMNNVYDAAQLLSNSPLIEFHDRRTITQGVMRDHANRMLHGAHTLGGNVFQRGEPAFSYKGLYPFDSFVTIELLSYIRRPLYLMHLPEPIETMRVTVSVVNVMLGPEQFLPTRRYMADIIIAEGSSIADDLRRGGRYLARASRQSSMNTTIEFFPILEDLYFVDITDREMMNYVWRTLESEMRILQENTNMLMLTGTKDMTALPMVQSGVIERSGGQFFTYEDYLNANPVMIVPRPMAGLLGETVTLTLRDMRTFVDGAPFPQEGDPILRHLPDGAEGQWRNIPAGYWVSIPRDYEGNWRRYPTVEIEVTVIGTYFVSPEWTLPRWAHIRNSFRNMEVFVPASIIPEGFGIVDAHMVSGQYSFVLTSPMVQPEFLVRYQEALAHMGFMIQFAGEDPTNFWLSAAPIRNAIRLNLVLFSAVLAVVLALTVFVYLRQRYKEFAIMRALGVADGNATWQVIVPVLVLWLPVVVAASIGAWFFALGQADVGLAVLEALDVPYDTTEVFTHMNILQLMRHEAEMAAMRVPPQFSVFSLILLCAAIVAGWVAAVFVGVRFFAGQSMILLLQSAQGGVSIRMAKETGEPVSRNIKISDVFLLKPIVRSFSGRVKSALRHHFRHILRAPVKTALVLGMALMFIVALGWLDATIHFTESEIERLYATTPVTGEVVDADARLDNEAIGGHRIPMTSFRWLLDSGFVEDYYYTQHVIEWGLFPSIELPGGVTLDWNIFSRAGIVPAPVPATDIVKTFSCWDRFVYESSCHAAFGVGLGNAFDVTFAPGFSAADLVADARTAPQYVIVHESLLERDLLVYRGGITPYDPSIHHGHLIQQRLSLGDMAYLGHAVQPNAIPVKIIGVYSGGHPRSAYFAGRGLVLMPARHDWGLHMSSLVFTIRQDKIAYLDEFESYMAENFVQEIRHTPHWTEYFNHAIVLHDAELRMVVTPLRENLNLLQMLYPVARGLSFVIALGLCLLLMLQNLKNAAILWVLGKPRYKTRFNLCAEQLAVCVAGLVPGFVIVLLMGVGVTTAGLLIGIYLAGALIGTVAGVVVITQKAPMELLQVRE